MSIRIMGPVPSDADLEQRFDPQPDVVAIAAMRPMRLSFLAMAHEIVDGTHGSREQAAALTALEEAKYWANQAIARHGVPAVPVD